MANSEVSLSSVLISPDADTSLVAADQGTKGNMGGYRFGLVSASILVIIALAVLASQPDDKVAEFGAEVAESGAEVMKLDESWESRSRPTKTKGSSNTQTTLA